MVVLLHDDCDSAVGINDLIIVDPFIEAGFLRNFRKNYWPDFLNQWIHEKVVAHLLGVVIAKACVEDN